MRRIATLCNVASAGLPSNCFLAIPQGLSFDAEGHLMVVYHELDLIKRVNLSVIQLMEKYNDVDAFAHIIFTEKYHVMLESEVRVTDQYFRSSNFLGR